ncbi:hypothetical protein JCM1841_000937 [Sporobolomyces salmonicolor]
MVQLQSLVHDITASNALIATQKAELEELHKEKEGNKENSTLSKFVNIIANKKKDKANVKAATPDIHIEDNSHGGADAALRDPVITVYKGMLAIPVLADFYMFIIGLVTCNVNEGSYLILLEYSILKIEEICTQIEVLNPSISKAVIEFFDYPSWGINNDKTQHLSQTLTFIGIIWDMDVLT